MDRRLLLALVAVLGLGWGFVDWLRPARGPSPAPSEAPPTPASVDRIAAAPLHDCPDAAAPAPLDRVVELRVFVGAGVDAVRVDEILSAARRYWGRYGVEVRQVEAPQSIALDSMFAGDFAELEDLAGDREALTERLYRELREFMRAHALPARGGVNVVVTQDIVHPRAAAAAVLGDLVGLTLAPPLLASDDPTSATILAALELGDEFEPTVLLSDRHLRRLDGEAFVGAVAHELGHALGLAHDERRDNLMARAEHVCLPGLDREQIAVLARR